MKRNLDNIVKECIRTALNEELPRRGTMFNVSKPNASALLAKMYGGSPADYVYDQANNRYTYEPRVTRQRKIRGSAKPKRGRPEGMSDEEYLELIRRENEAFRNAEAEMEGEEWRPIKNAGRYFGGTTDYARTHEISNMGRIRTIDNTDPMRSKISTGYDAPTRGARQFHLDSIEDNGESRKTTPPIHTLVADAWLEPPEGDIGSYEVQHIDGDYHNNRADNLRYVLRNPWKNRNKNKEIGENMKRTIKLTESDLHNIVNETVRRILRENDEEFTPHGYKATSNWGGNEIQLSDSGDAARIRFNGGEPSDWLEIQFDDEGVAYIETDRGQERLCDYMRF